MERFLIAIDCLPGCLKTLDYISRLLKEAECCDFKIFHILPTASPDKLRMEEVKRIERVHATRADLAGYFWKDEDERNMNEYFSRARESLASRGIAEDRISCHFGVESGDLADIILAKASELECTTVVLGRRRQGRVKEFLLGSVSHTLLKLVRGAAVWVIEI
ncbi:MAG: universal stress protein [Desulfobacteraceae bacterium]|nr:universal stress protein [Desulfobacteraceae bacterium]